MRAEEEALYVESSEEQGSGKGVTALFTERELATARKLCQRTSGGERNGLLVERIVHPAISRINQQTRQENNEKYLGYVLEHLVMAGV